MEERSFSVIESVKSGWHMFVANVGLFLKLELFLLALYVIYAVGFVGLVHSVSGLVALQLIGLINLVVGWFVLPSLLLGFIRIMLDCHQQGTSSVGRIFSGFRFFPSYFLANIINYFIMVIPMFFLLTLIVLGAKMTGGFVSTDLFSTDINILQAQLETIPASLTYFFGLMALALAVTFAWWSLRIMFFRIVIVDQNSGAVSSLKKSFALTRGNVVRLIGLAICVVPFAFTIILIPVVGLAWTHAYHQLSR